MLCEVDQQRRQISGVPPWDPLQRPEVAVCSQTKDSTGPTVAASAVVVSARLSFGIGAGSACDIDDHAPPRFACQDAFRELWQLRHRLYMAHLRKLRCFEVAC